MKKFKINRYSVVKERGRVRNGPAFFILHSNFLTVIIIRQKLL